MGRRDGGATGCKNGEASLKSCEALLMKGATYTPGEVTNEEVGEPHSLGEQRVRCLGGRRTVEERNGGNVEDLLPSISAIRVTEAGVRVDGSVMMYVLMTSRRSMADLKSPLPELFYATFTARRSTFLRWRVCVCE